MGKHVNTIHIPHDTVQEEGELYHFRHNTCVTGRVYSSIANRPQGQQY